MKTQQKIKIIQDLANHYIRLNKCFDQVDALIGSSAESALFNSTWKAFDSYIKIVEQLIGDKNESVSWFVFENSCGKCEMVCSFNKKDYKIKTVTDLVKFIELTA